MSESTPIVVDHIKIEIIQALDDVLGWRRAWNPLPDTPTADYELAQLADAVMDSPTIARLVVMLEQQHVLVLDADGWSIEHPIICRLDGQTPLHECPHHVAVAEHVDLVLDEWGEGSYRIWLDDTIWCGFDGTPT